VKNTDGLAGLRPRCGLVVIRELQEQSPASSTKSSHRSSAVGNRELNGRSSRCDADHPFLDLYSPSQPNAEAFALGAAAKGPHQITRER
jgi:hypothetical protein